FDDGRGPSLFVGGRFKAIDGQAFHNIARLIDSGGATPTILAATPAAEICAGGSVGLSVDAIGHGPLEYQWRKNGIDLTDGDGVVGAHASVLTLSGLAGNWFDEYDCRVADEDCSVFSAPTYVTVSVQPPVISRQPTDQVATIGAMVYFYVSLDRSQGVTFQWRKDGIPLTDGTNIEG